MGVDKSIDCAQPLVDVRKDYAQIEGSDGASTHRRPDRN